MSQVAAVILIVNFMLTIENTHVIDVARIPDVAVNQVASQMKRIDKSPGTIGHISCHNVDTDHDLD